ncbi:MAG: YCF48-related protein [Saprospiraceae bacterium]|nr:YCF48-related protein [Saprospiraceae bacterium]
MKHLLLPALLLFALSVAVPCHAQWLTFTPNIPDTVGIATTHVVDQNIAWAGANQYVADNAAGYNPAFSPRAYVFRTTNGGQSWSADTVPLGAAPFIANICGIDGQTAWLTGYDFAILYMQLLQTTDGGKTWTEKLLDGFKIPGWSYINNVYFWDAQNGIVCGDPAPLDPDTVPFYEIYRTSDGGQNWTRVPKSALAAPLPGDFGLGNCYAAVGDHFWFGTVQGMLYHSPDRGATWQTYTTGMPSTGILSFADSLNGICGNNLGGRESIVWRTVDGGKTWKDVSPAGDYNLSSAAIIPGSRYFLVTTMDSIADGPFRTLISKDGGNTWQQIAEGENPGWAYFVSPTAGYAGDWQTTVSKTRLYRYNGDPLSGVFSGNTLDAAVTVSPNPANDVVQINLSRYAESTDWLILLNDAAGRLAGQRRVQGVDAWKERFDLQSLPAGVYTLTISNSKGSLSRQIQIVH